MALITKVDATITYECRMSEEDEQKIRDYIGDTDLSVEDAIMDLYVAGKIDLYKNCTLSDFCTDSIIGMYREEEKNE